MPVNTLTFKREATAPDDVLAHVDRCMRTWQPHDWLDRDPTQAITDILGPDWTLTHDGSQGTLTGSIYTRPNRLLLVPNPYQFSNYIAAAPNIPIWWSKIDWRNRSHYIAHALTLSHEFPSLIDATHQAINEDEHRPPVFDTYINRQAIYWALRTPYGNADFAALDTLNGLAPDRRMTAFLKGNG